MKTLLSCAIAVALSAFSACAQYSYGSNTHSTYVHGYISRTALKCRVTIAARATIPTTATGLPQATPTLMLAPRVVVPETPPRKPTTTAGAIPSTPVPPEACTTSTATATKPTFPNAANPGQPQVLINPHLKTSCTRYSAWADLCSILPILANPPSS